MGMTAGAKLPAATSFPMSKPLPMPPQRPPSGQKSQQLIGWLRAVAVVTLIHTPSARATGDQPPARAATSCFMNFNASAASVISSLNIRRQILVAAAISGSAKPNASTTIQPS